MKIKLLLLTMTCLLLVGCKEDKFGETALSFVNDHAKDLSERLTKADLPLRYHRAQQAALVESLYLISLLSQKMVLVDEDIKHLENSLVNISEENRAWKRLDFSKKNTSMLLEVKSDLEFVQAKFNSISTMCLEDKISNGPVIGIGIYGPLGSFHDIQRMLVDFEPLVRVQTGMTLNTGGEIFSELPSGATDMKDSRGAVHATAVTVGTIVGTASCGPCGPLLGIVVGLSIDFIGQMFISNTERKKYEAQRKKLNEAIEKYPTSVLDGSDVLPMAKNNCESSQLEFQAELDGLKGYLEILDLRWKEVYKYSLAQLQMAEKYLLKKKVRDLIYTPDIIAALNRLDESSILLEITKKISRFRINISQASLKFHTEKKCLSKYLILENVQDIVAESKIEILPLLNSENAQIKEKANDFYKWLTKLEEEVSATFEALQTNGGCNV